MHRRKSGDFFVSQVGLFHCREGSFVCRQGSSSIEQGRSPHFILFFILFFFSAILVHVAFTWGNALGWENYQNSGPCSTNITVHKPSYCIGNALILRWLALHSHLGGIFYCKSKSIGLSTKKLLLVKVRHKHPKVIKISILSKLKLFKKNNLTLIFPLKTKGETI